MKSKKKRKRAKKLRKELEKDEARQQAFNIWRKASRLRFINE